VLGHIQSFSAIPLFGSDYRSGMPERLPSAELSQLIEAWSALSNVDQHGSGVDSPRFGRQRPKRGRSGTIDSLQVGMVLMHNSVKCIE
jgi:hypothetical protein